MGAPRRIALAVALIGALALLQFVPAASAQGGDNCIRGEWAHNGNLESPVANNAIGTWFVEFPFADGGYATINVDGGDNLGEGVIPLDGTAEVQYTVENFHTGRGEIQWGDWQGIPGEGLLGGSKPHFNAPYRCTASALVVQLPPTTGELNFERLSSPPGQLCSGSAGQERPNYTCTPGAVSTTTLSDKFCAVGYTNAGEGVRQVPGWMKERVRQEYGVSKAQTKGWQIDHLIPLGLGGSNAPSNLWPERDYTFKDTLERNTRAWICGRWNAAKGLPIIEGAELRLQAVCELREAQTTFESNWMGMSRLLDGWKQKQNAC